MKTTLIVLALVIMLLIGFNMYNSQKAVWFEGSNEIDCSLETLDQSLNDLGAYFVGVIRHMPSMTSVDLVDQGVDFVTIQTNEGIMKRTNITKKVEGDRVLLEFDEEYQAKKAITTSAHFLDEFVVTDKGLSHRVVISKLKASGIMGFLYRNFGSSSMGKAFLGAHKSFLEK